MFSFAFSNYFLIALVILSASVYGQNLIGTSNDAFTTCIVEGQTEQVLDFRSHDENLKFIYNIISGKY